MSEHPKYELRRDPQTGHWRIWCNEKDSRTGKPRGWDAGDGNATYPPERFWEAQRRVNWLNWPSSAREAGQMNRVHSPEEELARKRALVRAELERVGKEYLARTRHQLVVRQPKNRSEP